MVCFPGSARAREGVLACQEQGGLCVGIFYKPRVHLVLCCEVTLWIHNFNVSAVNVHSIL